MMTIYAPIAFGPLPLLAFQRTPDGHLSLVASGDLAFLKQNPIHLLDGIQSTGAGGVCG